MRPSLYVSNIFKGNVMRPSEAQEIIEEKIEIIRTMLTNEDMVKLKSLGKEKEKKEFGAFVFENFDIIVAYINNPAEINMTDNSKIDLIKLGAMHLLHYAKETLASAERIYLQLLNVNTEKVFEETDLLFVPSPLTSEYPLKNIYKS